MVFRFLSSVSYKLQVLTRIRNHCCANINFINMSFGFFRRDSDYGYSDDTVAENIYIFEVFTRPSEDI